MPRYPWPVLLSVQIVVQLALLAGSEAEGLKIFFWHYFVITSQGYLSYGLSELLFCDYKLFIKILPKLFVFLLPVITKFFIK